MSKNKGYVISINKNYGFGIVKRFGSGRKFWASLNTNSINIGDIVSFSHKYNVNGVGDLAFNVNKLNN